MAAATDLRRLQRHDRPPGPTGSACWRRVVGGLVLGAVVERCVMRFVGRQLAAQRGDRRPRPGAGDPVGARHHLRQRVTARWRSRSAAARFASAAWPLLSRYDLFVFAAVLVLMVGLGAAVHADRPRAEDAGAAFAPDISRLLGVPVGRMLTLGWALAAAVGALAALLVVPTELGAATRTRRTWSSSTPFTAAVVGGLDSPGGAVVGGLVVGLVLSYVSGYFGADIVAPIVDPGAAGRRCCWSAPPGCSPPRDGQAGVTMTSYLRRPHAAPHRACWRSPPVRRCSR